MTTAWIVGLIEGDGGFYVSKQGFCSLEITLHANERQALMKVKQALNVGSVKPRTKSQSLRYRLHHHMHLKEVLPRFACFLRTEKTFLQYQKVCQTLEIPCVSLSEFQAHREEKTFIEDAWLAGFFDAEGHWNLNRRNFQIALTIAQKDPTILSLLVKEFGGGLYADKPWQGWVYFCSSKKDLAFWWQYFSTFPLKTPKAQELVQIKRLLLFRNRRYVCQASYRPRFLRLVKVFSMVRKKRKSTES